MLERRSHLTSQLENKMSKVETKDRFGVNSDFKDSTTRSEQAY